MPVSPDKNRLISICIPSYNAPLFTERCIRSILNSTYSNLEIIVSDDSDNDQTQIMIKTLSDSRITYFHNQSRLGPPLNWNHALHAANGDYIGLLNHDDMIGPFWLELASYQLNKNPNVGTVVSSFRVVDKDDRTLSNRLQLGDSRILDTHFSFYYAVSQSGFGLGYITRNSLLQRVGFYDPEAGAYADYDLILKLSSLRPVYYSSNPYHVSYRVHRNNLTLQYSPVDRVKATISILKKRLEHLPDSSLKSLKNTYWEFVSSFIDETIRVAVKKKDHSSREQLIKLKETIPFER